MSIASLADDEILRTDRRRLDLGRVIEPNLGPVIANFHLDNDQSAALRTALRPVAEESPIETTRPSNALDGLVKYIPTESITLYVAATAAMSSVAVLPPWLTQCLLYWAFVALTPILFLLIYMGKRRSQNLTLLPTTVAAWPWWKFIAATIAFMVWALAVPPLVGTALGKVASAFGALLVSTLLTLVGGVVERLET